MEERILDAKIELSLKETLDIAKKNFHEFIIGVIKKKKQMMANVVIVKALDSYFIKKENQEIE